MCVLITGDLSYYFCLLSSHTHVTPFTFVNSSKIIVNPNVSAHNFPFLQLYVKTLTIFKLCKYFVFEIASLLSVFR